MKKLLLTLGISASTLLGMDNSSKESLTIASDGRFIRNTPNSQKIAKIALFATLKNMPIGALNILANHFDENLDSANLPINSTLHSNNIYITREKAIDESKKSSSSWGLSSIVSKSTAPEREIILLNREILEEIFFDNKKLGELLDIEITEDLDSWSGISFYTTIAALKNLPTPKEGALLALVNYFNNEIAMQEIPYRQTKALQDAGIVRSEKEEDHSCSKSRSHHAISLANHDRVKGLLFDEKILQEILEYKPKKTERSE